MTTGTNANRYYLYQTASTGLPYMTDKDKVQADYYSAVNESLKTIFDKVSSDQVFGAKDEKRYKLLALFHQFYYYLTIIYDHMQMDIDNNEDNNISYYYSYYCLDTIMEKLYCMGMKRNVIRDALTVFGLIKGQTGLGYMQLGGSGTDPFVVS